MGNNLTAHTIPSYVNIRIYILFLTLYDWLNEWMANIKHICMANSCMCLAVCLHRWIGTICIETFWKTESNNELKLIEFWLNSHKNWPNFRTIIGFSVYSFFNFLSYSQSNLIMISYNQMFGDFLVMPLPRITDYSLYIWYVEKKR